MPANISEDGGEFLLMRGNRFWEFYLVRYLLGTIFGIIILFYLINNYNCEISKQFFGEDYWKVDGGVKGATYGMLFQTSYEMEAEHGRFILELLKGSSNIDPVNGPLKITQTGFPILAAIILAVSGFLYMYFSSMIILVLHGLRYAFFGTLTKVSGGKKVSFSYLGIFIIIVILISHGTESFRHWGSIMGLLLIILLLITSGTSIKRFYGQLSDYRTRGHDENLRTKLNDEQFLWKETNNQRLNRAKDYVESYKHLREHGNAFGIIVCEILFAAWLIRWDFSYWAIFYWCLCGFLAWTLGTYLEVSKTDEE